VKRLAESPRDTDLHIVETLRKSLTTLLPQLQRYQADAGVAVARIISTEGDDSMENWEPKLHTTAESASDDDITPVEKHVFCLPSDGMVDDKYKRVELNLRVNQAKIHLNHLRDLIAEKSFQYSDVIRPASSQDIVTRARSKVKNIDHAMAFHAQVYKRCQSRMVCLGATPNTLESAAIP
jgi:hypothetical protein